MIQKSIIIISLLIFSIFTVIPVQALSEKHHKNHSIKIIPIDNIPATITSGSKKLTMDIVLPVNGSTISKLSPAISLLGNENFTSNTNTSVNNVLNVFTSIYFDGSLQATDDCGSPIYNSFTCYLSTNFIPTSNNWPTGQHIISINSTTSDGLKLSEFIIINIK